MLGGGGFRIQAVDRETWRPSWRSVYMLLLGRAVRFLHFAVRAFLSLLLPRRLRGAARHCGPGYRLARTKQWKRSGALER
jgi:hypothetical protein